MNRGFRRRVIVNDYTAEQRLAEVNKAIQAVLLGGQSYKLGSRSVTRADLEHRHWKLCAGRKIFR